MTWLIGNWKIGLVMCAASAAAAWYFTSLHYDSKLADLKQSIADAKTEAEEKQKQKAIETQRLKEQIENQRRKINTEAINADDPSYGCIVNGDGMQILAAAKNDTNTTGQSN